jgi:hypothetical protein
MSSESASEVVLRKVADAEGEVPGDLDPPLFQVVDPDALDALFAPTAGDSERTTGMVRFEYLGYKVTVLADGSVTVRDPSDSASAE